MPATFTVGRCLNIYLKRDLIGYNFNVMSISEENSVGYILEVDLEYPQQLHNEHSDYPLAPESMIVTDEMLSPHSKRLKDELNIKGKPVQKLIPNIFSKTRYVLHYQNLKLYLSLGVKID